MEMTEDREFESFVKTALEDGIGVDSDKVRSLERLAELAASRRAGSGFGGRWRAVSLLAAGLALAVAFRIVLSSQEEPGESVFEDAIGLLYELDGIEQENLGAASDGELLLALQEAPCADLL